MMITQLRPYQLAGVDAIHDAFAAGARAVCYTLPTGGGKTVVFADIARRAVECGTRTAILVHRDALLEQASAKLREVGIAHSLIAPGRRSWGDAVHVASVQTLVRRLERHEFDLVVTDEAHHATSPTYQKILAAFPDAHHLGVTATPCRADGRSLDSIFERLVLGPSIPELIADGYLVEPVAYGPAKPVELGNVRTRMGDYDQRQLAAVMDDTRVTGDAVDHYRRICPGVPAVAFCVNVRHAEDVARDFAAAGFRAASVDGSMPLAEIRRRTRGLADGSVQVLASCDLVSEGFDVPAVTAVIGLRPTKSLTVYVQQGGRALRPVYAPGHALDTREGRLAAIRASDKPRAVILDHAGNSFRFGLLDDARDWSLEGRPKRGGRGGGLPVAVRQCPVCFRTHPPAPACPECGHAYEVGTREPEVRSGELAQIDKDALRRARELEVRQAGCYEDLKAIGKRRGYKLGWAWHVWSGRRAAA